LAVRLISSCSCAGILGSLCLSTGRTLGEKGRAKDKECPGRGRNLFQIENSSSPDAKIHLWALSEPGQPLPPPTHLIPIRIPCRGVHILGELLSAAWRRWGIGIGNYPGIQVDFVA